ncbi:GNAT family N-acetyltransferase [Dermabacter hominis]|uniref:GNAT family N-acetyltransferase n=1 Tax=Dermabacter hominis TaxID=36740 RepID=UPI0021A653E6|nr:GNAT family N-acetyltransferase [Dermabacter hominis]MCT1806657.1 GNAT family N-acetyltransferase [Dermabacter hominis]
MSEKYALTPRTEQLFPEGPHVTVRFLDDSSDAELKQYWDLHRVLDEEFCGSHERRTPAELRAEHADTDRKRSYQLVAEVESLEGARMIAGLAELQLPLAENTDTQEIDLVVYPAWRGKGIGTMLTDALRDIMTHEGRPMASGHALTHVDSTQEENELPAVRIATRLGLKKVATGLVSTVSLPLDRDLVEDLHVEVEASLGKYRIITWEGDVPEEHMGQWCVLLNQLFADAPAEDSSLARPEYDEERVRAIEAQSAGRGYRRLTAVALAPNGTFAGTSYVMFREDGSRLGEQAISVVMPEHRGHNLGLALKLMTHRLLTETESKVDVLRTYTNHTNTHMNAVNERLGYRTVAKQLTFEGKLREV